MNFAEIQQILEAFAASDVSELTVKCGDTELTARKGRSDTGAASDGEETSLGGLPVQPSTEGRHSGTDGEQRSSGGTEARVTDSPPASTSSLPSDDLVMVRAPMLGIFYRSPRPGEPPFAEEGDLVQAGDTIGSIEVMKLFSSLTSPVNGRIVSFLAPNAELVQHDQPIVTIEPDPA